MEGEKKKVMVAIDESECSLYALEWTLQKLHDSLLNSELVLFTVQPIVDYGYFYAASFGVTSPEFLKIIQENQKKTATALLDKAKDICRDHGFCAETIIEAGDPKDVICEEVEKLKIELLVLGSHSRGALQRAFLGSVSNYCVHNAKCPVLVVKKKALNKSSFYPFQLSKFSCGIRALYYLVNIICFLCTRISFGPIYWTVLVKCEILFSDLYKNVLD